MTDRNIFADEWRQTLRAHYIEVIRKQDTLTERTLENVMYEIGFTDADLQEMRVYAKATLRAEDMESLEDFTPDAELVAYVEGFGGPDETPVIEETIIEDVVEIVAEAVEDEALLDSSESELDGEYQPESGEDEPPKDDSSPAQLSLF